MSLVFFFKQKTAYVMRISDWSSDVCSSDLEATTGPEIWEQMEHEVDAIVCGVGSGGTITGLARFFAKVSDKTEMVLADPKGSILAEYIETGHLRKEIGRAHV